MFISLRGHRAHDASDLQTDAFRGACSRASTRARAIQRSRHMVVVFRSRIGESVVCQLLTSWSRVICDSKTCVAITKEPCFCEMTEATLSFVASSPRELVCNLVSSHEMRRLVWSSASQTCDTEAVTALVRFEPPRSSEHSFVTQPVSK